MAPVSGAAQAGFMAIRNTTTTTTTTTSPRRHDAGRVPGVAQAPIGAWYFARLHEFARQAGLLISTGINAAISRKSTMTASSLMDCIVGLGVVGQVGNRYPLLPFRDRLLVDAIPLRKCPQSLFTILYCSTDRLCRRGTPLENLAT